MGVQRVTIEKAIAGADAGALAIFREICALYCAQAAKVSREVAEEIRTDTDIAFARSLPPPAPLSNPSLSPPPLSTPSLIIE